MPEEVRVPPEKLRRHAQRVERVTEDVGLAREAGVHVQLGREAYGQLCQFLPGRFDEVQQAAIDAMVAAQDALTEAAHKVRSAASGYEVTDEHSAVELGRISPV